MTSLSTILSSSLMAKDTTKADTLRVSLKTADSSRKAQCDLCKLSYSTEKELLEHCLSLMHHTKLEDREKNSSHECVLCNVTCSSMTDYRRHIMTVMHHKKLCSLKGVAEKEMNGRDDRGSIQTSKYSFLSNSGYGSTKSSHAKKPHQRDTDFSEKKIPNTQSKMIVELGRKYQDSNLGPGQALDSGRSQIWSKGSWRGENPHRSSMHKWSRDEDSDQGYSMEVTSDKGQQDYEQSGVSSSGYHGYNGIGGYSRGWGYESSQDWARVNNGYQSKGLEDASEIDFTSDILPTDWDELSLLENEQFLAGINNGFKSSKPHSHLESEAAGIGRWCDDGFRDRKRPLNRDGVEESFAKSSRSFDSSSDDSLPVRDIPKRQVPLCEVSSINSSRPAPIAATNINALSKLSAIDDASNNLLERAERLCKELREKREASHLQRNSLLKKQVDECLNQKMSALVEKQQLYLKGHVTSSKEQQSKTKYDSSIGCSLRKQPKQNGRLVAPISRISTIDSGVSAPQGQAAEKMLKDTNKAVEESMPRDKPQFSFKDSSVLRKVQRGIFQEDAKFAKSRQTKDLATGVTDKPLTKLASKTQLTKDSLMKMVNTPNSRDKRLQLDKMLQSREEQKAASACALRTGLQLEGLYDSVFDCNDPNVDENDSAQSVNFEDLSDSVRQQILGLIGREDSCQVARQPETRNKSPARLLKSASPSPTHVIVLSDDDDQKDARKSKKNNSTKLSSLNSPLVLHDIIKTIKKKKTLTGHGPKGILKHSVVSSLTSPSLSRSLHVNHSGNLRPTSPVLLASKAHKNSSSHTDNNTVITSSSTESKLENKQNTSLRERILQDLPRTALASKINLNVSPIKTIPPINSKNEVRSPVVSSSQIHDQLNSANVADKFPTLLNICKADRILSHKENTVSSSSDVSSCFSKQADDPPDKSGDKLRVPSDLQVNFTALSPKSAVGLSSVQIAQEEDVSETSQTNNRVLSPSSLPSNQASPHIYEKLPMSFGERSIDLSPISLTSDTPVMYKDSTVKYGTSADVVFNVEDHAKADNSDVPDNRIKTASVGVIGPSEGSTSKTMTKLLVLSEKEEHVKQEKMTMDLRLSRLHKLLEQAVVQINMCTDRMNELHDEEQGLLRKRLSLLRDATSLKPNWPPDNTSHNNAEPLPSNSAPHSHPHITETALHNLSNPNTDTGVSQVSTSSTISASTCAPPALTPLDKTESSQTTSLSRSDWLAKFASYLPKDSVTEANKTTVISSSSATSISGLTKSTNQSNNSLTLDCNLTAPQSIPNSLQLHQNFPEKGISPHEKMKNEGVQGKQQPLKSVSNDKLSKISSNEPASKNSNQNMEHPVHSQTMVASAITTSAPQVSEAISHSFGSFPIMYVGSFRSADCPMRLVDPAALVRAATESTLKTSGTETPASLDDSRNIYATSSSCEKSANISTYNSSFADLLRLPNPPRSHIFGKGSELGGEESDIGSVASSIASGSSLGEKITRYCKATPGASLDSKEPFGAHELSVILSDTSEQLGLDSQEDENHNNASFVQKRDWYQNIRACSVSLERLDDNSRKNVYGSLDEKTVKSAEALHLLERDYENLVGPSSISSDTGKRKRRKTKQERDTSDFSRRRHNCFKQSSSEEEESGKSKKSSNADVEISVMQVKGSDQSSGDENGHGQKTVKKTTSEYSRLTKLELDSPSLVTVGSNVTMADISFMSPSKTTSNPDVTLDVHDSSTGWDIVDLESVNLRINSLKELGNGFHQRSSLYSKSPTPDVFQSVNSSQTDGTLRNGYQSHKHTPSSHSQLDTIKQTSTPESTNLGSTNPATPSTNPSPGWTSLTSSLPRHSITHPSEQSTNPKSEFSSVIPKTSLNSSEEIKFSEDTVNYQTGRFPCAYGPVFDICVGKGQMYVGHVNRGVRVYNMSGLNQDKCVKEYMFPYLQCMSLHVKDGVVTLIAGNGCSLVICNSTEEDRLKLDLGTTIKCLLALPTLVYAGLDTGEVCMYDTMKKKIRDRCICSERPIHCLAAGQEGAVKLLCVSSQDGAIIVVNAQQCLPIRILNGHSKTAFSIQVEGHLVFSGSGDHTVLIQNLHTAAVEHTYRESKGLIKSVCYSQGHLFTGGMDKLVRCYDVQTHELVQVFFGADRGVITKILVLGDLLITGTIAGSVQVVDIDFQARNRCHVDGCGLNFGIRSHLFWHLLEDHNISSSNKDYLQGSESVCA